MENGVNMKIKINKTGPIIPVLTLISILILSVSLASAAEDYPSIVNRFSGDVTLNDEPAPVGTIISASIGGTDRGSVVVETAGKYVWLGVSGSSLDDGVTITFMVDGFDADQQSVKWYEGKEPRPLDLTTTGTPVSPPGGGDTNGGSSSSGGGGLFPPSSGGVVDDAGDTNGTDTSSVPDDGATSDAPSTEATTTATDESGAGSEEENGTFPWLVLIIIAGLVVVAIIAYLMRK